MNYFTYKPTVEEYNRYCPRWKKTLDLTIYAVALIGVVALDNVHELNETCDCRIAHESGVR